VNDPVDRYYGGSSESPYGLYSRPAIGALAASVMRIIMPKPPVPWLTLMSSDSSLLEPDRDVELVGLHRAAVLVVVVDLRAVEPRAAAVVVADHEPGVDRGRAPSRGSARRR
jgi:hypothetical protein